jgi:hypothetical protein
VQRLVSIVILTVVVARLSDPALSDRFFMGLGIVEGIGALIPVGFLAIVTPALMSVGPAEAISAATRLGNVVSRVMLAVLATAGATLSILSVTGWAGDTAYDVPIGVLLAFTIAAMLQTATARDAALAQWSGHAEYLVLAPLAGNAATLALLARWRIDGDILPAALAVAVGTGVHWLVLRRLVARQLARPRRLSPDVAAHAPAVLAATSSPAERVFALAPASLVGAVIVAGLVQGAASLLVVLARALVGNDPGAVTDVSLGLRIALLPPGLLAYPAWLTTAPLLARPEVAAADKRVLVADGVRILLLTIGVLGGAMAGAAEPLVTLVFGSAQLAPERFVATVRTLVWGLPLAVTAGGFVFLAGAFQAHGETRRFAAWVAGGLPLSAAVAALMVAPPWRSAAPSAVAAVAGIGIAQSVLLLAAARSVPVALAPPPGLMLRGLLLAFASLAAGAVAGGWLLDQVAFSSSPRSWMTLVGRLSAGGGVGGLAGLAVAALDGRWRRHGARTGSPRDASATAG